MLPNGPPVGCLGHSHVGKLPGELSEAIMSYGCGSKPMGSHFGVGEFTPHFRAYFCGDWDVHWGYGILTHSSAGMGHDRVVEDLVDEPLLVIIRDLAGC